VLEVELDLVFDVHGVPVLPSERSSLAAEPVGAGNCQKAIGGVQLTVVQVRNE
ncbi:MAG: hypothetical protein H6R02_3045, partial [Burkholderiaceae bacterium]|nr:hypothetical protein [Burkholderiaceae bacterium]